jgi:hypothetical protein
MTDYVDKITLGVYEDVFPLDFSSCLRAVGKPRLETCVIVR